ncbi:hypothetical protein Clacol_005540 [Clathrus columnatus]|uniref:Neugrin n=1 Tax=Clathrus columnatus TaxID=1419009 RepID=A0AAV5AF83_9AGAM|nr:hypothetical protein Clacol_005540 [Clathrus columnatus]
MCYRIESELPRLPLSRGTHNVTFKEYLHSYKNFYTRESYAPWSVSSSGIQAREADRAIISATLDGLPKWASKPTNRIKICTLACQAEMSLLLPPHQQLRLRSIQQLLLTSSHKSCLSQSFSPKKGCHVSSSSVRSYAKASSKDYDPLKPNIDEDLASIKEEEEESSTSRDAFGSWLESQGRKFQYPSFTGPKWLGGNVPFPLNPTFKPPPPLSDRVRDTIYRAYVSNPAANDLRVLSVRYGISIPRVDAILKLKSLEARWREPESGKTVQTGFQVGMESLLGVSTRGQEVSVAEELNSPLRDPVKEADETAAITAADMEAKGGRKHSLSRTYFEPVNEGEEPIVSKLITEAQNKAREKANSTLITRTSSSDLTEHVVQPDPNRPAFRFIDVGLKWFDPVDASKRQKESERRKGVKARRKTKEKRKIKEPVTSDNIGSIQLEGSVAVA